MNRNTGTSNHPESCRVCGAELNGKFCCTCGERRFDPKKDLSLLKFIEHSVDVSIHFDAKFFKTIKKLFFYPGSLTLDFISGRRVINMKPFQLFIFAGFIFYFLLPGADSYHSSVWDFNGKFSLQSFIPYNGYNEIVEKSIKYHTTTERVANAVTERTMHSSKLFLFVIIPFWAFILYALFYRSNSFYIPHLVFSVHCYSFFIFVHALYLYVLSKFMNSEPLSYFIPLFGIFAIYLFFAVRKVYQTGIAVSIIKGLTICLSFLILLELYRESITLFTLHFL